MRVPTYTIFVNRWALVLMLHKESRLISQVKALCWTLYRLKTIQNNWGALGQYSSEKALADCLSLPYPSQIFDNLVSSEMRAHDLYTAEESDLIHKIKTFYVSIEDNTYSIFETKACNLHLKAIGSDCLIQMGRHGNEVECFCGRGTQEQLGDFLFLDIKEDLYCTPNIPFGMAAVINKDIISIKHSTLDLVYDSKWLSSFSESEPSEVDARIGYRLKKKAMEAYCQSDIDIFKRNKTVFLKEYRDLLVNHECGHYIIQQHMLYPSPAAFSEASKVLEAESDLTPFLELLADLAPQRQDISGPILQCVVSAQEGRSEWLLYLYMSDAWFYDQSHAFMQPYSDLIGCVILLLIQDPMLKETVFEKLVPSLISEINRELSLLIKEMKEDICVMGFFECKETGCEENVEEWVAFFEQIDEKSGLKVELNKKIKEIKKNLDMTVKKILNIQTDDLKSFILVKAKELELL